MACIDNGLRMVRPGQLSWFEFERWLESAHIHELEVFGAARRPLRIQVRDRRPPPKAILRPQGPRRPQPSSPILLEDGRIFVPDFRPDMRLYRPRLGGTDHLPPPREP